MTYFTARSNLVPYAFVWENGPLIRVFMMDEGHYLSKPEASMYDIAIGLAKSNSALFQADKRLKNQLIE